MSGSCFPLNLYVIIAVGCTAQAFYVMLDHDLIAFGADFNNLVRADESCSRYDMLCSSFIYIQWTLYFGA